MAVNNVKSTLVKLGLSETETNVYLAMLKLGADTVQHIAREARISRTAAYEIISALEKKGLASTFTQGKRKHFVAEDPEKLEGYFSARLQDTERELRAFSRVLPEMRLLQNGGDKPRVRFYKGDEAVHALFRDVAMVEPKDLYEICNVDVVYGAIDTGKLLVEREQIDYNKIHFHVLHRGKARNPAPNAELRELTDGLDFAGDVWIYGNRIAFTHFSGKIEVVIIDNQIFADTLRAMFMAVWECEKVKKTK